MSTKLIKTTLPALAVLFVVLTGCASNGGTSGTEPTSSDSTPASAAPAVTLAVPETSTAGKRVQVVIESNGLDGTAATLYQFAGRFTDKPPTCQDEEMKETEINLTGGPQPVEVSNETPGDIWFVLRADKLSTECGAAHSVTRAMLEPTAQLRWKDQQVKVGTFTYSAGVSYDAPGQVEGWELTVNWYGPFATVPAAEAASCSVDELGPTSSVTATRSSQSDEGWVTTAVKLTQPGVYRVGWSVAETPWSVKTEASCDDTNTVVVK